MLCVNKQACPEAWWGGWWWPHDMTTTRSMRVRGDPFTNAYRFQSRWPPFTNGRPFRLVTQSATWFIIWFRSCFLPRIVAISIMVGLSCESVREARFSSGFPLGSELQYLSWWCHWLNVILWLLMFHAGAGGYNHVGGYLSYKQQLLSSNTILVYEKLQPWISSRSWRYSRSWSSFPNGAESGVVGGSLWYC